MKLSKTRQKEIMKTLLVGLVMLMLSILYVLPNLKSGVIPWGDDIEFSVNRVQELILNLKRGNWYPYIYTYQFNRVPDPLGIFYPQITTLPIALLCLLFKNEVIGICLGFSLYTFIAMLSMYWVVRKLGRNRQTALLSAVTYTFSTYRAMTVVTRVDIGEFIAMSFIPITLYGVYAVMRRQSGVVALGMGLSMIMLSHVLSAFLCVLFLMVEFICLAKSEKHWRRVLLNLLKSIGLFTASSAIWLVPFVEQVTFQKLSRPQIFDLGKTASSLSVLVINSLNNSLMLDANKSTIGILLLIVMIWGVCHYRLLDNVAKDSLILGIVTTVISTSLIPWGMLNNTLLDVIQFPFRLLMFSTVFLSLNAGDMLNQIFVRGTQLKQGTRLVSLILVITALWYSGVRQYRNNMYTDSSLNMFSGRHYAHSNYRLDVSWHLPDYAPQGIKVGQWKSIYNHTAMVDDHKFKIDKIVAKPDGLVYYDHRLKGRHVTLPVMVYKNIQLIQGGHRFIVNKHEHGMVHLENTNSKPIEYKYIPSVADNLSRVVSFMTWCLVMIYTLGRFTLYKSMEK